MKKEKDSLDVRFQNIALSLEFLGELFLMVVKKCGVWNDDNWQPHPHSIQDGARA